MKISGIPSDPSVPSEVLCSILGVGNGRLPFINSSKKSERASDCAAFGAL